MGEVRAGKDELRKIQFSGQGAGTVLQRGRMRVQE